MAVKSIARRRNLPIILDHILVAGPLAGESVEQGRVGRLLSR
jgi:hypothetical protein